MTNYHLGTDAAKLLLNSAWSHFAHREFELAENCFLHAYNSSPTWAVVSSYASFLGRIGQHNRAIQMLEGLEETCSENENNVPKVELYNQRAELFRQAGRSELARQSQQRAVALELRVADIADHSQLSPQTQFGCARDLIALQEYSDASKLLTIVIDRSERLVGEASLELGRVYLHVGHPELARCSLQQAGELFSKQQDFDKYIEAARLEARALVELGMHSEAIARLESALKTCLGRTITSSESALQRPLNTLRRRVGILLANPEWN